MFQLIAAGVGGFLVGFLAFSLSASKEEGNPLTAHEEEAIKATYRFFQLYDFYADTTLPNISVSRSLGDSLVAVTAFSKKNLRNIKKAFPVLACIPFCRDENIVVTAYENIIQMEVSYQILDIPKLMAGEAKDSLAQLTYFPMPNPRAKNFPIILQQVKMLDNIFKQNRIPYNQSSLRLTFTRGNNLELTELVTL